jgi:hypothetical protein
MDSKKRDPSRRTSSYDSVRSRGVFDSGRRSDWYDDFDDSEAERSTGAEPSADRGSSRSAKRRSLSGFWSSRFGGWSGGSWRGSSSDSAFFDKVRALESLSRVGRIVFGEKMSFSWLSRKARDLAVATGDMIVLKGAEGAILLDKTPLEGRDGLGWNTDKRVDVVMGQALAEAAQNRYALDPADTDALALRFRRQVGNAAGKRGLRYIAVQKHVEALAHAANWLGSTAQVTDSFPGYAGYFDTSREWRHRKDVRTKLQTEIDATLSKTPKALSSAVVATLWETLAPAGTAPLNTSEEMAPIVSRVADELRTRASAARTPEAMLDAAARALSSLLEFELEPGVSIAGAAAQNEQSADAAAKLGLSMASGSSEQADVKGEDVDTAKKLESAVSLGMRKDNLEDLTAGYVEAPNTYHGEQIQIVSQWAKSDPASYSKTRSRIYPLIQRTRSALAFRNEIARMDEVGLRSGLIDEGALASAIALANPRVFRRQEVVSAPSVHMGLLVDQSGSMRGPGIRCAQDCATLLWEAAHTLPGVAVSVWGHTANLRESPEGALLFRYLERSKGDHERLGSLEANANNLDGAAIAYAGSRMRQLAQPAESSVLFVLCDGAPSGQVGRYSYSGTRHTRECVSAVRRAGTQVYCFGMGDYLQEAQLNDIYGPDGWQLCKNPAELPQALAQLVKRLLRTGKLS